MRLEANAAARSWGGWIAREWPRENLQLYMDKIRKDNLRFLSAALAWNILLSVVPLSVGMLALTSAVFHGSGQQHEIVKFVSSAFQGILSPKYLDKLLNMVVGHNPILMVTTVVGVIWAAEQVGFAFACAFEAMFEVRPRRFLKEKLVHIGMFFAFVLLMLLIVGATTARQVINRDIGHAAVPNLVQILLTTAISLVCAFILFGTIYLVYPHTHRQFRVRHVWKGALVAGVLFQVLTFIWPLYVAQLSKYGGILFPLLVLVLWIYFFALIALLGGEVVAIAAIHDAVEHGGRVGELPDDSVPQHDTMHEELGRRNGAA